MREHDLVSLEELRSVLNTYAGPDDPRERTPTHKRTPRGARLRRPAFLTAAGLGIAGLVAATMFAFGAFSAGAAYAVTTNPDGTITITLSQFSALPALNQELVQSGLPLRAVPVTADCPFNPNQGLPLGQQGPGSPSTDTITIGTSELTSEGAVGVIGVSPTTSGGLLMMESGVPADAVPSCINSAAFGTP
jgi:hypothetical protein